MPDWGDLVKEYGAWAALAVWFMVSQVWPAFVKAVPPLFAYYQKQAELRRRATNDLMTNEHDREDRLYDLVETTVNAIANQTALLQTMSSQQTQIVALLTWMNADIAGIYVHLQQERPSREAAQQELARHREVNEGGKGGH